MAVKVVEVKFDDYGSKYNFKTDIEGIAVGDKVVVDTAHGFSVATVTSLEQHTTKKATKFVVQVIDVAKHEERLEREAKRLAMVSKMEARRKKLQEMEIYRLLAKEDEEMAKLLEEYQEMEGLK